MGKWIPTREAALTRLETFVPQAGRDYARQRNYDLGPGKHGNVSALSPWLRHRLLLECEVVNATLQRHSFSAAEKFIQEVCWRTYWKGWLERRPSIWRDYRLEVQGRVDELDRDSSLRERWQAATSGRTGIDCFDHWSRELVETGYLHNHARMWFASIWIFTLELPWALGADFFLRHLLDGDPASNTLSWRWVAGLQTRGKTYLARPGNIAKYTEERFRPEGQLAPKAPPLAEHALPEPSAPPQPADWDRDRTTGLLLTEDDLSPEFLVDKRYPFAAVLALKATSGRSPLSVPSHVHEFVDWAFCDALGRLGHKQATAPDEGTDRVQSLVEHAAPTGIKQLVTPYVPVGPTADALEPLRARLDAEGIELVAVPRRWDTLAWPHATRGFFAFWKQVRPLLGEMGVEGAPESVAGEGGRAGRS